MGYENNYGQMNQQRNAGPELDFSTIFYAFIRRWFVIIPIALILGIAVGGFVKYTSVPRYTSETSLIIVNKHQDNAVNNVDLTLSARLSKDYISIVKSRTVLERVVSDLDLNMTAKALNSAVSATIVEDTRMIIINVTNTVPKEAKRIADGVAKEAKERINEVMGVNDIEVSIIDAASLPTTPNGTGAVRKAIIAALIGLIVTWGIYCIVYLTNDTIKTPTDIKKYLDCTVLGVIPLFDPEASITKAPVAKPPVARPTVARPQGTRPQSARPQDEKTPVRKEGDIAERNN